MGKRHESGLWSEEQFWTSPSRKYANARSALTASTAAAGHEASISLRSCSRTVSAPSGLSAYRYWRAISRLSSNCLGTSRSDLRAAASSAIFSSWWFHWLSQVPSASARDLRVAAMSNRGRCRFHATTAPMAAMTAMTATAMAMRQRVFTDCPRASASRLSASGWPGHCSRASAARRPVAREKDARRPARSSAPARPLPSCAAARRRPPGGNAGSVPEEPL